jgi:hypothetical protein
MGSFAETAIVDYCLTFADQGKQNSIFHFRLQQTNGSLLLSICSVFCVCWGVCVGGVGCVCSYIYIYICIYIYMLVARQR